VKKTFVKALVRAAFIASCLAFCACKDISVMVDEYNGNCLHERIWGNDTGSNFKYDARLLIPEESYEVEKTGRQKIILSCVVPCKWYLKVDDGAEDEYPEDPVEYTEYLEEKMNGMTDVPDPADPTYTYASVYFNTGRIRTENNLYYNTIIEIKPSEAVLAPGKYKLFVMAWMLDTHYIDVAEVTVKE
jgi:hypothetical protein